MTSTNSDDNIQKKVVNSKAAIDKKETCNIEIQCCIYRAMIHSQWGMGTPIPPTQF